MERGELSYSKVRELTRVACPATEDYLIMIAAHGTAHHVEQLVRYYRHAKESEELTREVRQQKNRTLQYFYDHDGSRVIKARLPAQAGALFMKAIDKAAADLWETEPEAVEADTQAQRALRSRDKGCRFPGCCNTRYTDAHHIHHWAHGGETKLSNLRLAAHGPLASDAGYRRYGAVRFNDCRTLSYSRSSECPARTRGH